jgi:hypothetical protein
MAIDGRARAAFRPRGYDNANRNDGRNYSPGLLAAMTVTGVSR